MIDIKNVNKWFGDFHVLKDASTRVEKGEVIVVCGPSGSGKSTLIKCVNGLEPFQEGTITVNGVSVGAPDTNLPELRSQIGMVFQNFELFPHMTAMQNICLSQLKVLDRSQSEAQERANTLLDRVGLGGLGFKYPSELSGGQQQRVAIARALAGEPRFLLADEPTGNLDSNMADSVLELLAEINSAGTTIIMVTHELALADRARRNIFVRDGQVSDNAPELHLASMAAG